MEMDHGDVEDALAAKQRELDEALLQLRISREVEARMGRAAPTVSLLPAQRRLDRFRGDVGAAATREWIADARACLATHQGASRERVSFLLQHLGGNARLEVTGHPDLQGNPEGILNIIEKTFGDGAAVDLPQLQEKFYTFKQGNLDLLSCSLELVNLFDRIVTLDPTGGPARDTTLKGRLAAAVSNENLVRELRRLNLELPNLTYFELRDRARRWLGSVKAVTKTVNWEITTEQTLWNKLQDQQKELDELKRMLYTQRSPRVPTVQPNLKSSKDHVCWTCGQPGHLKRDCPTKDGNPAPVALSN